MDYLVGVDLGSTSLKAVVYDAAGNVAAQAARPTELCHPNDEHPDWAVWQPQQIWSGVAEALREATSQLDGDAEIRGVAVTGMGMDGVPIDRDGKWLYPFISWHCPRTAPQQAWWLEHVGAERQFAITGNPVWGINTALRLLWMREHEPAILDKTDKWLLIEDFINFMLCGERATDYSMASNTLLFDQRTRAYSPELLALSGIDPRLLCDPRPSGGVLGEVHAAAAEATGLPKGTKVVLGGHDFLCACLPVGAFEPGVVLDDVGTWEKIVAALDEPILTDEVRRTGWWVDSHVARGRYVAMGTAVAAEMLEWFRDQFARDEARRAAAEGGTDWDYLMAAAEASPVGARGAMFLPHLSGATIPEPDPASMGAFVGLRNTVSKGDMIRAIVESLNYQFLQILAGLATALKVTPETFVAVGGGARNAFWMQNKADMVGKCFEAPEIAEATPLGAAILAGIGTGVYRDERDAFEQVYKPGRVFEPTAGLAEQYAERFDAFQRIYPALKDLNGRLRPLA